ncbi:unnamed protein product [Owenia fusiformis]|uniref:Chitin-binding type-2 domain-containing protein n=1 Tax=Owenia fusiformis TaxID=6347 RepID=A0A8S4PK31_OWEFU|nr:unnamed protein product [Owenia fusiformis]
MGGERRVGDITRIFIYPFGRVIVGDGFVKPEKIPELTDAQLAACELTGLISADDSCCHFIKCDLNQKVGWQFPCLGKTVWNPILCSCVPEKTFRECNRTACPPSPTPGTIAPCSTELGTEECCLEGTGQVFSRFPGNSSRYFFGTEPEFQVCPPGQEFFLESCCCEGNIEGAPKPCIEYEYDTGFVDIRQNVHGAPSGVSISRPGLFGDGAAKFGSGNELEIPYFSNAYMGIRFAAATYFNAASFSEDSDGLLLHNGEEGGAKATVKIEIMTCNGNQYLVAGVDACDRTEDVVLQLNINPDTWYRAFFTFNEGEMTIGYGGEDGSVIDSVSRFEPDPLPTDEIVRFMDCTNEGARRSLSRANDAVSEIPQPVDTERRAKLSQAQDCLNQINGFVDALGDFTNDPEGSIGLTDLRKTTKELKPLVRRCKKGKSISTEDLDSLVDVFSQTVQRVNMVINDVKGGLVKLCELKEDKPLWRDILGDKQRKELNVLKRKLRRAADAIDKENPGHTGGNNEGKYDILLEEAQDCQSKLGRRKKRDVEEGIPSIKSSKHPIMIGQGFVGQLDHTQFCFDGVLSDLVVPESDETTP